MMINRVVQLGLLVWLPILLLLPSEPQSKVPEETFHLTIIYSNDVHGGIGRQKATFINPEFPPQLGGGASLAAYIKARRERAEAEGGGFLLVDAGDCFQGTPVGTKTKGSAVIEFMNAVGYDCMTVGNHDYDEGFVNLRHLAEMADFPLLGANVVDSTTGKIMDYLKPYIIKEFDGIRIGIIGLAISSTPRMAFPDNVAGHRFLPEDDVLREQIENVRAEGVDLIFVVTHDNLPYDPAKRYAQIKGQEESGTLPAHATDAMELAHRVPGVDVMFCGHLHKGYYRPWEDPVNHTIMFQTYGNGTGFGEVTLRINKRTKTIEGYHFDAGRQTLVTLFEDQFWPDSAIGEMISAKVAVAEAGMDEPIGETLTPLTRGFAGSSTMGMVITDAMREMMQADFAFSNVGGVRADIPAGRITARHLFKVMPFGNKLVKLKVTGAFLKKILEAKLHSDRGLLTSGGRIVYNMTREFGDRVTVFEIGGEPLDLQKTYDVVTTDYLAEGNSGMEILLKIPEENKMRTWTLSRDMVEKYIARHSPLNVKPDGRFVRDDTSVPAEYLRR